MLTYLVCKHTVVKCVNLLQFDRAFGFFKEQSRHADLLMLQPGLIGQGNSNKVPDCRSGHQALCGS